MAFGYTHNDGFLIRIYRINPQITPEKPRKGHSNRKWSKNQIDRQIFFYCSYTNSIERLILCDKHCRSIRDRSHQFVADDDERK